MFSGNSARSDRTARADAAAARIVRRHAELILPGGQIDPVEQAHRLLESRLRSGRMFVIVSESVLPPSPSAGVDREIRQQQLGVRFSCRSLPAHSTPNSTDAFGAAP